MITRFSCENHLGGNMKKSLSIKRALTTFACLVMVLIAGLTLAACGGTESNEYITPGSNASFSSAPDVKYNNASDFALTYKGNNHYEATGSAAVMDATQASTWGTVEGSKYVVVNVKMGEGSTAIIGWRSVENKDNAFEESEIDGTNIKTSTAANDTKNYILALSDGDAFRHEDLKVWRIEVTPAASEGETVEPVYYTIDFSALYNVQ